MDKNLKKRLEKFSHGTRLNRMFAAIRENSCAATFRRTATGILSCTQSRCLVDIRKSPFRSASPLSSGNEFSQKTESPTSFLARRQKRIMPNNNGRSEVMLRVYCSQMTMPKKVKASVMVLFQDCFDWRKMNILLLVYVNRRVFNPLLQNGSRELVEFLHRMEIPVTSINPKIDHFAFRSSLFCHILREN